MRQRTLAEQVPPLVEKQIATARRMAEAGNVAAREVLRLVSYCDNTAVVHGVRGFDQQGKWFWL